MLNSRFDDLLIMFGQQFAGMQIHELVELFNRQTRHKGWVAMRAYHDKALIGEFRRRGIDVSCVSDGNSISFARQVCYDEAENRLAALPETDRADIL